MLITDEEDKIAFSEGWCLMATNKVDTPFEIQKLDDEDIFKSDKDAWLHVAKQSMLNESGLHIKALTFIALYSPIEFKNICEHIFAVSKNTPIFAEN